jgi:hypothetical protein
MMFSQEARVKVAQTPKSYALVFESGPQFKVHLYAECSLILNIPPAPL